MYISSVCMVLCMYVWGGVRPLCVYVGVYVSSLMYADVSRTMAFSRHLTSSSSFSAFCSFSSSSSSSPFASSFCSSQNATKNGKMAQKT